MKKYMFLVVVLAFSMMQELFAQNSKGIDLLELYATKEGESLISEDEETQMQTIMSGNRFERSILRVVLNLEKLNEGGMFNIILNTERGEVFNDRVEFDPNELREGMDYFREGNLVWIDLGVFERYNQYNLTCEVLDKEGKNMESFRFERTF